MIAPDDVRRTRRVILMQKLIGALRRRTMSVEVLSDMLGFSNSTTYRYLRILREAEIIEIDQGAERETGSVRKAVYRLSHNSDYIRVFDARGRSIDERGPERDKLCELKRSGSAFTVTIFEDGSRIHRLADDSMDVIRPVRSKAIRDPMVAALFGAPKR